MADAERNRLEVKIQGRFYTIVANETEEYIYKICSYVDKKLSEVSKMNPRLSTDMAAVLTSINLSDELYRTQSAEDNLRKQVLSYSDDVKKADERAASLEKQVQALQKRVHELEDKLQDKQNELEDILKQI